MSEERYSYNPEVMQFIGVYSGYDGEFPVFFDREKNLILRPAFEERKMVALSDSEFNDFFNMLSLVHSIPYERSLLRNPTSNVYLAIHRFSDGSPFLVHYPSNSVPEGDDVVHIFQDGSYAALREH